MLAVLALLAVNALNLLAAGYASIAERDLDVPGSARALAAAGIARALTPWSARRTALHGWMLAQAGDVEAAKAAYQQALRWSRSEPLLWSEYALVLARVGHFDGALAHATRQAATLAPQSPAVQRSLAEMGLSYWRQGGPEHRAVWLEAMRRELALGRREFLAHALTRGQGMTFCRGPALELGEAAWCRRMAGVLVRGCYTIEGREPAPCKQ